MSDNDKTVIAGHGGRVAAGTRLNGIYQIDSLIGSGGMSEIYRGHNVQTFDKVAIKVILPHFAKDEQIVALFRREALILNRLSHEAIVRYHVFSHDAASDLLYLAMEFVEGPTLRERMAQRPLSQLEACQLVAKVAQGMKVAHAEGVVHRDLSSDNIILANGDVARPKVIDFGIARSGDANDSTLIESGFAGKYNYVAPEQLGLYGGHVGPAADIYSLGLVFAAALRGRPLDMSGTHADVVMKRQSVPDLSQINPGVKPLIERMLQPNPAHRIQSMDDVLAALEMVLGPTRDPTRPGRAVRPAAISAAALPARRRRWPIVLPVLLLGCALGGWWAVRSGAISSDQLSLLLPEGEKTEASETGSGGKSETRAPGAEAAADGAEPVAGARAPDAQAPDGAQVPDAKGEEEPTGGGAQPVPPRVATDNTDDEENAPPTRPSGPRISLNEDGSAPEAVSPSARVDPSDIARWVEAFDGGDCFYVRPVRIAAGSAEIEGFSRDVEPLQSLDQEFRSAYGFEPSIGMRRVEGKQCAVVGLAKSTERPAMRIDMARDLLGEQGRLDARVTSIAARHLSIFLVTPDGEVQNITGRARRDSRDVVVNIPVRSLKADERGYLILAVGSDKPLGTLDLAKHREAGEFVAALRKEAAEQGASLAATVDFFRRE